MVCPDRLVVGGIEVYAFGHKAAKEVRNRRPGLVFLTHGRAGSAHDVFHICEELLQEAEPGSLICIVIEQRNHGRRMIDEMKNANFKDNCKYAADMFAILHGTAVDISYLTDMIPVFFNIFPAFIAVIGVSTGGYVALQAMANDRRINMGVSLIGFADYGAFIEDKAAKAGLEVDSRAFRKKVNEPLDLLLKEKDIVNRAAAFADRPVLFIGGGKDSCAGVCSDTFLTRLRSISSQPDCLEVKVIPEAAHELTAQMVTDTVQFVQKWGDRVKAT